MYLYIYICVCLHHYEYTSTKQTHDHFEQQLYIYTIYTYIEKYLYTLYLHSVHTRFTTKEASYIFTQTLSPPPFPTHTNTHTRLFDNPRFGQKFQNSRWVTCMRK